MTEFLELISDLADLLRFADVSGLLIPVAGVGGGIEAREHVELLPLIKYTLLFLGGVGVVFGISLALTAKKFSVRIDPRVEKVMDVLAHAH
ncbi:MAG: hypothetical protein AB1552_07990 [Nitrospirota bacterium]